jgi:hypothetical protein
MPPSLQRNCPGEGYGAGDYPTQAPRRHVGRQPCADPDDLVETSEVGDWKMPDFEAAYDYAASRGWLIVQDDTSTLTTAESA